MTITPNEARRLVASAIMRGLITFAPSEPAAPRKRPRRDLTDRPCEMCGKLMLSVMPNRKRCGGECSREAQRQKQARWMRDRGLRGKDLGITACAACGVEVVRKTTSQVYCTEKCRVLVRRGKVQRREEVQG